MRIRLVAVCLGLASFWSFSLPGLAASEPAIAQKEVFETKARQAYLVDEQTGTVLFAKNEKAPVPPASMAKLMTMEVTFDALQKGELTLDTALPVSEHAWRKGGAPSGTSTMFAPLNSRPQVSDLILGVIVQFANDACIVLAEGLSGSETAFADRMTRRAGEIGLSASVFRNATGLPDPQNRTTMRDMVDLARHMRRTYPQFFPLYARTDFEWNKIRQRNRNPLLQANIDVDGFVAGFAEGYGYGMLASMQKDDRRIFLGINGLTSEKERVEEARRMLDWAMTAFRKKRVFAAGEVVGQARVYGGRVETVSLVTADPVDILLPAVNPERISAAVVYRWPLVMPVKAGQEAGMLEIRSGNRVLREVPLRTSAGVEAGSLSHRALDALRELLFFWV